MSWYTLDTHLDFWHFMVHMEHVISLVEMIRSCFHVYVPEAMVGSLTLILIYFLSIEYIDHKLDTS